MAPNEVSFLINQTGIPYIYIPFFKISWKNQKIYFLNVNYVIRQSQVIPIDVLWSGHPYWLTVSIFRISKCEILMIFWHSHANTSTKQKIIWSGVYQNYSEVSINISAISWIFYEGLGAFGGWEIAFEVKKNGIFTIYRSIPPWLVKRPI